MGGGKSTGKLHGEVCGEGALSRDDFEEVLGALARGGWVELADAVFEKDGKKIPYRTVRLTQVGRVREEGELLELMVKEAAAKGVRRRRGKVVAKKVAAKKRAPKRERVTRERVSKSANREPVAPVQIPLERRAGESQLEKALKAWRLGEAKKRGLPAFRILTDKVLREIAQRRPETAAELLAIPGMGIKLVQEYGRAIYRILGEAEGNGS